MKFRKAIEEIFQKDCISVTDYKENKKKHTIMFSLWNISEYGVDLTYDKLRTLCELIRTDEVSFHGEYEHGYYDDIETYVVITCSNVDFE